MKPVSIYKAQGPDVPSLDVRATEPIPSRQEGEPEQRRLAVFAAQGQAVVDALRASLPGGTVDAILVALLDDRRSQFVVRHDVPDPFELGRLREAVDSAVCLLAEGPDAVGSRQAIESALRILTRATERPEPPPDLKALFREAALLLEPMLISHLSEGTEWRADAETFVRRIVPLVFGPSETAFGLRKDPPA